MYRVISIINIILASHCFFIALLLFFTKTNKKANFYLAILQLLTGISLFMGFFTAGNFLVNSNILVYFSISIIYFIIPLMYIYTVRLSETRTERDYEHFIISIIVLTYCIVKIILNTQNPDVPVKQFDGLKSLPLDAFIILQMGILINNGYMLQMNKLIRSFQKGIQDNYSSIEHIKLRWLRVNLTIGIIATSLFFISNTLDYYITREPVLLLSIMEIVGLCLIMLFLISIAYFSFIQTELKSIQMDKDPAYTKQRLSDSLENIYVSQLVRFMDSKKPYLDPELSMRKLSEEVDIPSAHLTMILNIHIKQNFYIFINTYRIKAACDMLKEYTSEQKNILTIAMDSGFNSKTTFNNFFKKNMGITPSEYRKSNLQG